VSHTSWLMVKASNAGQSTPFFVGKAQRHRRSSFSPCLSRLSPRRPCRRRRPTSSPSLFFSDSAPIRGRHSWPIEGRRVLVRKKPALILAGPCRIPSLVVLKMSRRPSFWGMWTGSRNRRFTLRREKGVSSEDVRALIEEKTLSEKFSLPWPLRQTRPAPLPRPSDWH